MDDDVKDPGQQGYQPLPSDRRDIKPPPPIDAMGCPSSQVTPQHCVKLP